MSKFEIPVGKLVVMGLAMSTDSEKKVEASENTAGIPAFVRKDDKGKEYSAINVTSDGREYFRVQLKNLEDKDNPMVFSRVVMVAQSTAGEWPAGSSPQAWKNMVGKTIPGFMFENVEVAPFTINREEGTVEHNDDSTATTTTVIGIGRNIIEAWKNAKKSLLQQGHEGIVNPDNVADTLLELASYRRSLEEETRDEVKAEVKAIEEEFEIEPK